MRKTYFSTMAAAIKSMHANFGIGDVQEIRMFGDGAVQVISKPYSCAPITRRGHVRALSDYSPFGKYQISMYGKRRIVHIVG